MNEYRIVYKADTAGSVILLGEKTLHSLEDDGSGLAGLQEEVTKPTTSDTDGDGSKDGDELDKQVNPSRRELRYILDPSKNDSDGDGLSDGI